MSFYDKVYEQVVKIPKGKVATYGQIAFLCGSPRASRAVGYALHFNPRPGEIPCHRVVKHAGRTAPGWHMQRASGRSRCYFQEKWIHRHAEM